MSTSVPEQPTIETAVLHVGDLHFASEKGRVERALGRQRGVRSVEANPVAQTATVRFDPAVTSVEKLRDWVEECGYHCAGRSVPGHLCDPLADEHQSPEHYHEPALTARPERAHGHGHGGHAGMSMASMERDMRNRFMVAVAFAIPIAVWSPMGESIFGSIPATPFGVRTEVWQLVLSLPVIFYSSTIFFVGAWHALRARTLDMMVLVAVAIGTGFAYSVAATFWIRGDVFYEAAAFLASFVLLGHWFEMRARGGANDAIRALLDLAPPHALVLRDGETVEVMTSEIVVGDVLLIRPGAKIAVDAVVVDGDSSVDESMVTGESLPVSKHPGDKLTGATINKQGTLRATAVAVGSDTALAQIVKLVQEAQNSKAPGQRLADRAAFWLVFVALVGGVGTFLVWLLAGQPVSVALLFGITVVVVTCPDALGLATPTAIMVGTGLGAARGVLFKNATAIETSKKIDTVVMDKTGTLTMGAPDVTAVIVDGMTENDVLALIAAVERESEHPLAQAVVRRADAAGAERLEAHDFVSVAGQGATATVGSRRVVVGNSRLMTAESIDLGALASRQTELAAQGTTAVLAAVDGRVVAVIAIADVVRPTSADAVKELRGLGIEVVMLTGDNAATAERIAASLGVTTVIADVLPGDKAAKIKELMGAGHRVAMVGDGVNDAPALAQADLGIAIGAGTDVAVETADVVLMRSDPLDVAVAVRIGRGTVRKMTQNLRWAIGYNSIALPIAAGVFKPAFGLVLRPEIAAITMAGSSILVAVNALTLKRLRLPGPAARN
ncbi:MAG: P-type Cu2+ transporter [Frankiaceae bacterium]|nr:P-type Cu2+ transporter [Frankiaceae bacterium]